MTVYTSLLVTATPYFCFLFIIFMQVAKLLEGKNNSFLVSIAFDNFSCQFLCQGNQRHSL